MKKTLCLAAGLLMVCSLHAASGINYDGNKLDLNNDFTRTECGTMAKKVMKEVSGLACSRQTPGFLWAHGDENLGSDRKIIAVKPSGELAMTVSVNTGSADRDDWEDIATGSFDGKNYVFIGATGDNDLQYADAYYIFYFEEPSITSGSQTINTNYIRFGYPDNAAHNTETLMYDNIEQAFYIADKADGVCSLYRLPFQTNYGTSIQKLTKVCELGNGDKFKAATGGDISPDGQWMAIKNEKYILLWSRQGDKSLSTTAQRRPVQIAAYEAESQGESLAWADGYTFYTTSDQKKDTPIYRYTRAGGVIPPDDPETPETPEQPAEPQSPKLYEVMMSNHYSAFIPADDNTKLQAYFLSGEPEPTIESYKVNSGTTWEQDGNSITLTGSDESSLSYTLVTEAVEPCSFTTQEMVLDGTETWIKGAYGFDATKKWRFSKTDDDYSREIAGRTHIEFFLPACDTVVLKSMESKERDARVYVNGEAVGGVFKLLISGSTFAVNQNAPFMLSIVSAQSSGDGGVRAIRLARRIKTAVETTATDVCSSHSVHKIITNGQLFILRDGQTFTITGAQVK